MGSSRDNVFLESKKECVASKIFASRVTPETFVHPSVRFEKMSLRSENFTEYYMFIKKYFELAYDYLFKGISKENFLFNGDAQITNASLSFL